MKTLLVLRHAKSSWDDQDLDDHERPLNDRGERDAPRMGALLREQGLLPDLILSSDAVRARDTARAAAAAAEYGGDIQLEPDLYGASPHDIVTVLRSLGDVPATRVMLVGHNPGLEDLVGQLTGDAQHLPTAALVQIELPIAEWTQLSATTPGTLVSMWTPKTLPSADD